MFTSLLIMFSTAILWMLPVTTGIYSFRTDVKDDVFTIATGVGVTSANVTLTKELYDDDTSTIDLLSASSADVPILSAYNSGTHSVLIGGLSDNLTRSVTVSYDYPALSSNSAVDTLFDNLPLIWYLMLIGLPAAAIAAIFLGKV